MAEGAALLDLSVEVLLGEKLEGLLQRRAAGMGVEEGGVDDEGVRQLDGLGVGFEGVAEKDGLGM